MLVFGGTGVVTGGLTRFCHHAAVTATRPAVIGAFRRESAFAGAPAGALETQLWTYEQRALACVLKNPGTPLLLTPASLLPDEPAAR